MSAVVKVIQWMELVFMEMRLASGRSVGHREPLGADARLRPRTTPLLRRSVAE